MITAQTLAHFHFQIAHSLLGSYKDFHNIEKFELTQVLKLTSLSHFN